MVEETQAWEGGLVAMSSFGFGGANMHLIMQGGARLRTLLQQAHNASSSDVSSESDEDTRGSGNIIPLAARSAEGLVYLAGVIMKARQYCSYLPTNIE